MTKYYDKIVRGSGRWMRSLLPAFGVALLVSACNSKSDDSNSQIGYVEPSNAAVTDFKLKANTKILSGLDSVFFSIDLQKGIIFNADSLPKGTKITDLIPVISYSSHISSAVINMEGGSKRTGEIDYLKNPNDSVDFTGNVKLTLTTSAGNSKEYLLKVNVHTMEPDSLCWGETAVGAIPSRSANPVAQRTVSFKDKVCSLVQEEDGTYTFAANDNPVSEKWTLRTVELPFTPRLRSLMATENALWMLATDGTLYTSADGNAWESTSEQWYNILGAYGDNLLGVRKEGDKYYITSYRNVYPDVELPAGFPIEDYTNMYSYHSKWMALPVCVVSGGVTSDGQISSAVWGFDGLDWAKLSDGKIPAVRCATLVPYYSYKRAVSSSKYNEYNTIFLIGGLKEDGTASKETYISYDNGVNWIVAPTLLQMPSYIPAMWKIDNTVELSPRQSSLIPVGWSKMPVDKLPGWYRISTEIDGTQVKWECPYIFLYGGCDAQGKLYNTIWRGLVNRLNFTPIV